MPGEDRAIRRNVEDRMAKASKAPAKGQTKRPVGRPSSYDPAYCEQVVKLGAEGNSPEEISAEINVPRTTMDSWAEKYPEFSEALTRAKDLELVWWEKVGKRALFADKFQQQVWAKSMQARFRHKYTERVENTLQGPNGGPISTKTEVVITIVSPLTDRIV